MTLEPASSGPRRWIDKAVEAANGHDINEIGSLLAFRLPQLWRLRPRPWPRTGRRSSSAWKGAYEPWNLTDSSGKIVGFEPDLVMDLCKRAGLECKIIAQDWDGMIPGLKAGKFDVIMDGMSITDERKKEIDFSKPYAASPGSFLAPKDSPLAKATGAGKLINLDKDAAAGDAAIKSRAGGAQGQDARRSGFDDPREFRRPVSQGHRDVKEYKTTDDRDLDLKSGRIDAVARGLPTNMATASKPDAQDLAIVGPKFIGGMFGAGEGMGIRKSRCRPHREVR